MGDVGDDYRAWDAMKKEERQKRKSANMEIINACALPHKIDASGTVLLKTEQGTVCFYPTTNTIMHKQKIMHGGAKRAVAYVQNISEGNDEQN
ncbi:hypothetical protein [Biostraticola tofi]|uniref:Uncharacterized protein n=1 Tax=Biostraticola tofi TaxID=466109 RepID=A0A4R3Z531_9GAMM|nr:hypothetical protein [Biostraticola tofi]TCW00438.1 hypothetical protein EDC52_101788 [Biostraticola tofi]